jgi:hypothetical protein
MATVTTTITAIAVENGTTIADVTYVEGTTTKSKQLIVPDNSTTVQLQAQVSADAQTWYTSLKWRDDLLVLVASPFDVTVT